MTETDIDIFIFLQRVIKDEKYKKSLTTADLKALMGQYQRLPTLLERSIFLINGASIAQKQYSNFVLKLRVLELEIFPQYKRKVKRDEDGRPIRRKYKKKVANGNDPMAGMTIEEMSNYASSNPSHLMPEDPPGEERTQEISQHDNKDNKPVDVNNLPFDIPEDVHLSEDFMTASIANSGPHSIIGKAQLGDVTIGEEMAGYGDIIRVVKTEEALASMMRTKHTKKKKRREGSAVATRVRRPVRAQYDPYISFDEMDTTESVSANNTEDRLSKLRDNDRDNNLM